VSAGSGRGKTFASRRRIRPASASTVGACGKWNASDGNRSPSFAVGSPSHIRRLGNGRGESTPTPISFHSSSPIRTGAPEESAEPPPLCSSEVPLRTRPSCLLSQVDLKRIQDEVHQLPLHSSLHLGDAGELMVLKRQRFELAHLHESNGASDGESSRLGARWRYAGAIIASQERRRHMRVTDEILRAQFLHKESWHRFHSPSAVAKDVQLLYKEAEHGPVWWERLDFRS
jgi:hypothetical protein